MLSLIGDGTYGLVYLATNIETSEKVAIKVWNMEAEPISVAFVKVICHQVGVTPYCF